MSDYRICSGQDVAVKVLKIQDLPEPMLDEFDREIDLMTKLRHRNIVQFVGASKVPGKLAIVTEFIEEGSVQVSIIQSFLILTLSWSNDFDSLLSQ